MTNAPDASSHHRMLHELVNAVVRERAPEQLEGLDSRVSHLVRLLEEEAADRKPEHHESGLPVLPFDPVSAGAGFSLATIVWLAYEMVRMRAGERLDRLEAALAEATDDAVLVRTVRRHYLGLVADDATTDGIDLRLIVLEEASGSRRFLRFHGRGDAGLRFDDLRSRPLHDALHGFIPRRLDEIRTLARHSDGPEILERRLRNAGQDLCEELLPPELVDLLLTHKAGVRTMQIVSDEPSVPWELLCLPERDGGTPAFLAESFGLTRWRPGATPARRLPLRRLALVAPLDAGLDAAGGEVEEIETIAGSRGSERCVRLPARQREVFDALADGSFDAWHFAAHCRAWDDDPALWSVVLEDKRDLRPADFGQELRGRSPFVFLNACSAGRSALSLTGLGGFADKLVQQGAGAVIGPLWEVGDRAASAMAVSFYRRFLSGGTLSQSLRDARLEVRQSAGDDPTWLAYTAFGHPDARIDPPAQDPSASSP